MLKLPSKVKSILSTIRKAGGCGFLVGGAVRDMLRGEQPRNWDFSTNLSAKQILAAFPSSYIIGGQYSAVKVPIGGDGFCEVTPFNNENKDFDGKGGRKPDFLRDIFLDLARRDFTVNAIAYDGDIIIDPFGGQEDINYNLIKCVGEPAARFTEDPVRILRLYRFCATLGMRAELNTLTIANEMISLLSVMNRAKVREEFSRILLSNGPQVLGALIAKGALCKFGFAFAPSLAALADVPCEPLCRWWALMALCGADFEMSGKALGFAQQFQVALAQATKLYRAGPAENKISLKKKISTAKIDYAPLSVTFAAVSPAFTGEPVLFAGIRIKKEPYRLQDLAVNSEMLSYEGVKADKCAEVLNELLTTVIENPELNEMPILLGIARKLIKR